MNGFYLYRKAWRYDGAPHKEPQLQEAEWKALLKQGGLMVRNTFDFDCQEETTFWNLIKDRTIRQHEEKSQEIIGEARVPESEQRLHQKLRIPHSESLF